MLKLNKYGIYKNGQMTHQKIIQTPIQLPKFETWLLTTHNIYKL